MSVRVKWTQKRRGDNHLPEFRPTDSDKLAAQERKIFDAVMTTIEEIPEDFYEGFLFNTVNETREIERLNEQLSRGKDRIAAAIFAVYVDSAENMASRLRKLINRKLIEVKSKARLVSRKEVEKANDKLIWEPFDFDTSIPGVDLFDQQPGDMPGKVYARFRAGEIISSISSDVQASIEGIIAEGFTAQQTFSTGRTVTGLTPDQTARRLFALLRETSAVPITGADYAGQILPYTNGLFPRWAIAVDRSMNSYANGLAERGIETREIIERTKKHGERYGNKLRRSRARMIARTETSFAQNRGMVDVMLQTQSDGLVGAATTKEWVVGPTDVCNICTPMAGTKVPLKQPFRWSGGSGDFPPAHPNCRCTVDMNPELSQPPTKIGSGIPEDPHRYIFADGWQTVV
jgi:methylphosphotriester-DNA--protein-cysteine methyltransferase